MMTLILSVANVIKHNLGPSSRTSYHNPIWIIGVSREIQISCVLEHDSIALRGADGIPLPPFYDSTQQIYPSSHTESKHASSSDRCVSDHLPSLTIWLRLFGTHRLHHLHLGQSLQASPRHVLTYHTLRKTIPAIQVPRSTGCHGWCCYFYFACPECKGTQD